MFVWRPASCPGPCPVVVDFHGGPEAQTRAGFSPRAQLFVDKGFIYVQPNVRGSDGYGRTWQLANRYLVGQGEIQDVAGAHAYLVARGCDPARIACTGRSWGGFQTMALLTQFPGLWACGVAGRNLGVEDHGAFVWDEIVAFLPLAALASASLWLQALAFALFRLFDIWKPFPIRHFERRVKGGLGVMLDDLLASCYAYFCFILIVIAGRYVNATP